MTPAEALEQLEQLSGSRDFEAAHGAADDVLLELVRAYVPDGHAIADAWDAVPKEYA